MGKKKVILKIGNPCDKDWDSFSQRDLGGYCAQCSRTVIDFTKASDEELYTAFAHNHHKICGRFNSFQLNREIFDPHAPHNSSSFSKLVAGLLIIGATQSGLTNPAHASTVLSKTPFLIENYFNKNRNPNYGKPPLDSSSNYIEGTLLDKYSNTIPFAFIKIKDTKYGVSSDKNGKFKISIPDKYLKDKIIVSVVSVGYEPQEFIIKKSSLPIHRNFTLEIMERLMGDVIVVSADN